MTITEVELLEISIVSVPCNQDSLFSIRKSFDSSDDYSKFVKEFKEIDQDDQKAMRRIKAGITDMASGHYHTVEVDENGNGVTTYASHMTNHAHKIVNGILLEAEGHSHSITMVGVPIHDMEEGLLTNQRPLSPTEEEAMNTSKQDIVEETKAATVDAPELTAEKASFEVEVISEELSEKTINTTIETIAISDEVETKSADTASTIDAEKDDEEEFQARDPNEVIPFVSLLSADTAELQNGDLVNYKEKMYKVLKLATAQSPIFKFLEIDAEGKDCDNVLNVNAEEISQVTKTNKNNTSEDAIVNKELHEDSTKENDTMAEQVVETIDLTEATKSVQVENRKTVNTVSDPRVANLVEKTGEALIKNADAQDLRGGASYAEQAELKELQFEISKYKDEIKALQSTKMLYQENQSRGAQFSEKEMANAVLLSKMLNKRDVFDTKFGSRMKAVTTVDQFLANFSSNIYTEMEQQLVIAPMFNRLAVDAKTFRVPVADEDTDGDVAMFKSGTYSTGIGDITNVPTSNQNTISSVDFTPHKFMATTHLAKDEEEDTVLPLLDFLRAAATRRLARAIDKSILRGTGALTGFTASPTNAITVGAANGYASVITGVTKLAQSASLSVSTGSANDKADPSDIAAARTAMGKYGLQLGNDLVYVTSIQGYNNLVTTSDFQTVDKFGPNATYLTGSVGAVYGIPIVVSEFLDNVGTTANALGTLLYKPGFMIAERRGIEIESEYEPRQQVTAMYMSTRFDFKALTTVADAALSSAKYAYAVNVNAG
jgi:HK97 family phage major capsid protein